MNQELLVRIAPITSRLWMLAPKPVQATTEPRQEPTGSADKTRRQRRPGQLIRTSA